MCRLVVAIIGCAGLGLAFMCVGAEEPQKSTTLKRWVQYYTEIAHGYDVRLKSHPDEPLSVSGDPVLVYSNPTIGFDTHGAFYVWTRNGRAEAIAAIWSKRTGSDVNSQKNVNHEFHSLATEPLVAQGTDGVKWTPKTGIDIKLLADAPVPAQSRAARLAQMREISRQFTGFDLNPREGNPSEDVERQLRVLPTPLYRYTEPDVPPTLLDGDSRTESSDGAVFGLFADWDPEILLVVETRPTPKGPRWHYGVAYLDYKPLRLHYKKNEVWSKPLKNFGAADETYYCVIGVTKRPVELE